MPDVAYAPQVDPPDTLPVNNLSVSSLKLFAECPQKWQRRYIMREYEPPSGKMILGSSIGAAEAQHYSAVIETGEGFTVEQVADEFSAEWDERVGREDIAWGDDNPGVLKDSGVLALEQYHQHIAPLIVPVTVEREFSLTWPGVSWRFNGFLDLEVVDPDPFAPEAEPQTAVADLKVKGKRILAPEADADWQATAYLYARRAEGQPATAFDFHTMVRGARKATAELVRTHRTDRQLDGFVDRLFSTAAEIRWRAENDVWSGAAPGSWLCNKRFCGYWAECVFGGRR